MRHGLKRRWSLEETNSSCSRVFSAVAPDTVRFEEVLHGRSNFYTVRLRREMSSVKQLNRRARYVLLESFSSRGNKKGIVLAPNRKQRWFRLAEIFLEFRIELYVRGIVQEQIELNLFIPRAFEQRRIQCVRLRRNTLRLCNAVRVLPARSCH